MPLPSHATTQAAAARAAAVNNALLDWPQGLPQLLAAARAPGGLDSQSVRVRAWPFLAGFRDADVCSAAFRSDGSGARAAGAAGAAGAVGV